MLCDDCWLRNLCIGDYIARNPSYWQVSHFPLVRDGKFRYERLREQIRHVKNSIGRIVSSTPLFTNAWLSPSEWRRLLERIGEDLRHTAKRIDPLQFILDQLVNDATLTLFGTTLLRSVGRDQQRAPELHVASRGREDAAARAAADSPPIGANGSVNPLTAAATNDFIQNKINEALTLRIAPGMLERSPDARRWKRQSVQSGEKLVDTLLDGLDLAQLERSDVTMADLRRYRYSTCSVSG